MPLYALNNLSSWFNNLAIVTATTTNANDSIKITSADGSALTGSSGAWVDLPGTTAGQTTRFGVPADVTILLTGATWGLGGTGDVTGALLRVLAINDNGTLRWGVAYLGGRNCLLTTDTSATQANIDLPEEVLCDTAVASATNSCRELGFVRSNFDDTGGAAEDLWANQTGVNDIYTGITADGYWQPWNPGYTGFSANPTSPSARFTQIYRMMVLSFSATAGTSSTTGFTITQAPCKAALTQNVTVIRGTDNGVANSTTSFATAAGSRTLTFALAGNPAGWTAANGKCAFFQGASYEVGPVASFIE